MRPGDKDAKRGDNGCGLRSPQI